MSLPRPSGLKPPSRIGRPSGVSNSSTSKLPQTGIPASGLRTPSSKAQSAIAKSARGVGYTPSHADQYAHSTSHVLKGPDPVSDSSSNKGDDFKIGDRIWVSGNKPGMIAFIGETQFAPGEWAGIVLDEPVGKNDGSINGVRYFQCELKRGVFSRLNKLSHTPGEMPPPDGRMSMSGGGDGRVMGPPAATTNGTTATSIARPSSRLGISSSKHMSTSSSSLHKSPAATPTAVISGPKSHAATAPQGCKVGDKVLVSGSKEGILHYVGETDFAKGIWAGVELFEPMGKNDGAVAGKRYFDCKPLYGLFAPVHKIAKLGAGASSTPSPHTRPSMSTSLRSARERSGSQESVSSISSSASSVSRPRVRLGVTSLANQTSKPGHRPSTLNLSATNAALQKALKEKEEHIEQLLRERDLERSEVARASAHVDETEGQLNSLKCEKDRLELEAEDDRNRLKQSITTLEGEKQDMAALLEEEKRKNEDLQFQLEEAALKDDEGNATSDDFQVKELERQIKREKERADDLEKEMKEMKGKLEEKQEAAVKAEEAQVSFLDQIEELTYKLTQADAKVKNFEASRVEDGAKTSQVCIELEEKNLKLKEAEESLAAYKKQMSGLSQQLSEMEEQLADSKNKSKKQDDSIQELTNKLKEIEENYKQASDDCRTANTNISDLQRQLTANQTKVDELTSDRTKLEQQLSDMMKNSGDSSSQMAALNDQLTEKNRKVEDLQSDLSNYSQKLAKAGEELEAMKEEKERGEKEMKDQWGAQVAKLEEELNENKLSIEKWKHKLKEANEVQEKEKNEVLADKEKEKTKMEEQLSQVREEHNQLGLKLEAHKQLIDKLNSDKDALQYEKQHAEKVQARLEGEKSSLNGELVQARVELSKLQSDMKTGEGDTVKLKDDVERLTLELDYLNKAKLESEKHKDEAKVQKDEVVKERDSLNMEMITLKGEGQKKDILIEELQNQLANLQKESSMKAEELMQKSLTEAELLSHELVNVKASLQKYQDEVKVKEADLESLQFELEEGKLLAQEKERLLKENASIVVERDSAQEKCRTLTSDLEKQASHADELLSEIKVLQSSEGAHKREKDGLESRLHQLEEEYKVAKQQTREAQDKLESASSDMAGDAMYAQLKEEAVSAMGQVDFLNSVIVDLQKKNKELEIRLAAMEDSGVHTNGDFNDSIELGYASGRAPPRVFCDICEVFDQHETEDCPKQAMSSSPEPTRYHGDRKNVRPYCEICESFGHSTEQCDDEQTF